MSDYTMHDGQPLDFDDYADQILEQGLQASPSLLHGAICGVLLAANREEPEYCLAAISQALELDIRGELAGSSLQLISTTVAALADEEFEFHLFLPEDDIGIKWRVEALGDWCRGFMAGYALALTEPEGASLGEEVGEILKDFAAIAEVGYDDEGDEEEAEHHYFEISEYLRFATLNLYLERAAQRIPEP